MSGARPTKPANASAAQVLGIYSSLIRLPATDGGRRTGDVWGPGSLPTSVIADHGDDGWRHVSGSRWFVAKGSPRDMYATLTLRGSEPT